MSRDRVSVGMLALSIGLRAKCGQLTQQDVDELQAVADQMLERDDPLFRAASSFATDYMLISLDQAKVSARGAALLEAVEFATRPEPVDHARRDIYG